MALPSCREHPSALYGAMLLDRFWNDPKDGWLVRNPKCTITGLPLINEKLERVHLATCALVVNGYLEGA